MKTTNEASANLLAHQPHVPEKPAHYHYLKNFRVEQCALFLQHKCTQHRPFTCFNWHFKNQRRRRPVRRRDGTFNYDPDTFCEKYDEQTGTCVAHGDECPHAHRNAGDTEKRYHIRYFKTAACVHETDAKGHCVKNGVHCAFAHGQADMRAPIYDINELQLLVANSVSGSASSTASAIDGNGGGSSTSSRSDMSASDLADEKAGGDKAHQMTHHLDRERILNEDPRWNDTEYVLANYKTEHCKRPPRLCRQGFACPQYHNTRDRRRDPTQFKYRSTPCPQVKQGDDWIEPSVCDSGDSCKYCHSRTEQQFHPEIYKSTKCNDMLSAGYCPRGPFCAFAHLDAELKAHSQRSSLVSSADSALGPSDFTLGSLLVSILPPSTSSSSSTPSSKTAATASSSSNGGSTSGGEEATEDLNKQQQQPHATGSNSNTMISTTIMAAAAAASAASYIKPIGAERESVCRQTASPRHANTPPPQTATSTATTTAGATVPVITTATTAPSQAQNSTPTPPPPPPPPPPGIVLAVNRNLLASPNVVDVEKLVNDLKKQTEMSNKLEALCLQYRQWVDKLTSDVNEWKHKYLKAAEEKSSLEMQFIAINKHLLNLNLGTLNKISTSSISSSTSGISSNSSSSPISFNSSLQNGNRIENH